MAESNTETAIEVKGLYKEFVLPQSKTTSLKQAALNIVRENKKTTQKVLNDINFTVNKGDFFGIVGRNGSGKSTLLKLLSGIYTPDKGAIDINGSLVPFIELGVGFNPELSGRDNVYLNGALLGYTHKQMDKMYEEIVDFAEIGPFMDQKLKNYSSGMQVRLAFSIAIRARADILVLDEVLAVGDEAFQRKCNDYFDKIRNDKNQTVILVTHSMEAVKKYCNKALLIDNGEIKIVGSPEDVANQYSLDNNLANFSNKTNRHTNSHIKDIEVTLLSPRIITEKDTVEILVKYRTSVEKTKIMLDLIDTRRKVPLHASSSPAYENKKTIVQKFRIKLAKINDTNIQVALSIRDEDGEILAFPPESELPNFILRRKDYVNNDKKATYAVLFDRGTWGD